MTRVSATQERSTLPTPYVDLDRRAWSRLRESHPMSLEQSDLARLCEQQGHTAAAASARARVATLYTEGEVPDEDRT